MTKVLKKIENAAMFQNAITIVILIAGVLVGMETYPALELKYGSILHFLDKVVIWIFVLEILIKMGAQGSRPWRYFFDAWNVFDFLIVAATFLPFAGSSVAILRLVRLLRVLKLVRALPRLQLLVGALLKSIPSMGYISILLLMLFYIYAVAAVIFFGENDPYHFPDLETSMLSLFRVVTLEDWTDVMYTQMYGCLEYPFPKLTGVQCTQPSANPLGGAIFFVSFVLIGTMVILNLFIGVIMTGMDEARQESEEMNREMRRGHESTLEEYAQDADMAIEDIQKRLIEVQDLLAIITKKSKN